MKGRRPEVRKQANARPLGRSRGTEAALSTYQYTCLLIGTRVSASPPVALHEDRGRGRRGNERMRNRRGRGEERIGGNENMGKRERRGKDGRE